MYTRFALSALALTMGVATQAATFSNTYFFGDSLSDSGAFAGIVPVGGKFTTNPASVWTELLADAYGQMATPNNPNNPFITAPGTNYAQGGAQVNTTPGFGAPPTTLALSVRQQVDNFIADHPAGDSKALFGVWAGANDIFYQFQFAGNLSVAKDFAQAGDFASAEFFYDMAKVQADGQKAANPEGAMDVDMDAAIVLAKSGIDNANAQTVSQAAAIASALPPKYVKQAALDMVEQIGALKAAGARYIVVPNLPNIGDTPGGAQGADPVAQATSRATLNSLSSLYNTTLAYGLKQAGLEVISLNINGVMKEIMANPEPFGITNTTIPACNSASSLICTPADLVSADAGDTYFFADGVHPTAAVHRMLAQYAQSVIDAPQQMAQLPNVVLQNAREKRGMLSDRLLVLRSGGGKGEQLELYVDARHASFDRDGIEGSAGTSGSNHLLTLGGDRRLGHNAYLGFALTGTEGSHDFSGNKGGFDVNELGFSLYGGVFRNGFHMQAYSQLGFGNLANMVRKVEMGDTVLREESEARAWHMGAGLEGGYDMKWGPVQTGPLLGLHYQKVTIGAFHERQADSVAMAYEEQQVKSMVGRAGWSLVIEQSLGGYSVRPFAELAWENEFANDAREVRGGLTSVGTTFAMPVAAMDGSYAQYNLGVTADFKSWKGLLSVSGVSGMDQGSATAINLNISSRF